MTDATTLAGPAILAALWVYAVLWHRRDVARRRRDYSHTRSEVGRG